MAEPLASATLQPGALTSASWDEGSDSSPPCSAPQPGCSSVARGCHCAVYSPLYGEGPELRSLLSRMSSVRAGVVQVHIACAPHSHQALGTPEQTGEARVRADSPFPLASRKEPSISSVAHDLKPPLPLPVVLVVTPEPLSSHPSALLWTLTSSLLPLPPRETVNPAGFFTLAHFRSSHP